MLWAGVVVAVAGGGLIVGGVVAAGNMRSNQDLLFAKYENRMVPSTDVEYVQILADARRSRKIATGLYLGGGGLLALGVTLIIVDLVRGDDDDDAPGIAIQPLPGGATLNGAFSF